MTPVPMAAGPRWIEVDGIRTRYFDAGSGDPILLITGGNFGAADGASIVETWDRNFGPLSETCRVIAIDKLGQGHTDNPKDNDYTMDAVVRHLGGFLAALGLERVHLVGQSRGAMAAACVALDYAPRIRSCTLVNTSTLAPGVGLNEVVLGGSPHPPLSREGQRWLFEECEHDKSLVDEHFLDEAMKVFALSKYRESIRQMEHEGLKARLFTPQLQRLKSATLAPLATEGIGRPTPIIWGIEDRTATVDRALDLFRIIAAQERRTFLHLMGAAGHHPYREHPAQFDHLMRGFLRLCDELAA